ncbi:hypothetical protein GQX74_004080 [Glossina fuscipes]|nr:hypothetical protein GQX74_004080 [Glossina fuscipes]
MFKKIFKQSIGASVQTEKCGNSVIDTWDCIYESGGAIINNINRTGVSQEIGPGCRCGCIVHLGSSKPKRIIAGATQSCPGRSFWLIQSLIQYSTLIVFYTSIMTPLLYIGFKDFQKFDNLTNMQNDGMDG